MTPPGNVTVTIVVPCGISSPAAVAGGVRRPGTMSGEYEPRKSVNDDGPGLMNTPGSRPACESWDATRLLPFTADRGHPAQHGTAYDPTVLRRAAHARDPSLSPLRANPAAGTRHSTRPSRCSRPTWPGTGPTSR